MSARLFNVITDTGIRYFIRRRLSRGGVNPPP